MYDQHYGLTARPFQLTPDPQYFFESQTHRKALSYLGYGLAQGEGFIVITGEIGAGKSTLVAHLMATIDPARLKAAQIVSTHVGGDDMLRLAAQAFDLDTAGQSKAGTLQQFERALYREARAGRRCLLIVDEAQNLSAEALEELRMLSNFQLGGQSLLQIFLLGQPEFRDLMSGPGMEQLRQRVIATHHLQPMMANEVAPYIEHRLKIAGWHGTPRFTPDSYGALHAATDGVPRRLNALVSRVLLLGAIDKLDLIDTRVVDAVVADMSGDAGSQQVEADLVRHALAAEAPEPFDFAQADVAEVDAAEPPQGIEMAPVSPANDVHLTESPFPAEAPLESETVIEDAVSVGTKAADSAPEPWAAPEPIMAAALLAPSVEGLDSLRTDVSSLGDAVVDMRLHSVRTRDPIDLTALEARVSCVEERIAEQEESLRRVLSLLVQWAEKGDADTPLSGDVAA